MPSSPFLGTTMRSQRVGPEHVSEDVYHSGLRLPRHAHEKAFFSLTLAGRYVEDHGRRELDYVVNSIAFHPPGEEHAVAIGTADVRCLNVELRSEAVDLVRPQFVAQSGGTLVALGARLYDELLSWTPWSAIAAEALILEMLALVGRVQSQEGDRAAPRWLVSVEDILRGEYSHSLTVADVARRVGVHPVHLSRTWRRFRGCSLGESLRRIRIAEACRRIASRHESLATVALDLGFADQAHFTRTFKQLTGSTPRAWRMSERER